MATVLSCPACGRQLSINQELAVETPVQCPACREVFTFSGESKVVPQQIGQDNAGDAEPQFSSTPATPTGVDQTAASGQTEGPRYSEWDDDDYWPEKRPRPNQSKTGRNILFASLALLILIVWAVLHFSSSGNPLVGSWKGTFQFLQRENVPCIYTFRRDGTMIDEHVDAAAGVLVSATGTYTFTNGKVDIRWRNGGFERATVRQVNGHTIEYVIQEHNDLTQIGGKATFVREER